MNNRSVYPIVISKEKDGYYVSIPDFERATQGQSVADAIMMARDAIGLMGIDMQDDGKELPSPYTKKYETVELTTKEHTSLHNEIRKLFIAKVQDNPEIDKIFNNFLQTYQKPLKTYEDFGGRLESYETALKEIALAVHALICDQKIITELYEKAFNQLISAGKIPSIKSTDNSKFEEDNTIAAGKELVESHHRGISRGSLLVDNEFFIDFD